MGKPRKPLTPKERLDSLGERIVFRNKPRSTHLRHLKRLRERAKRIRDPELLEEAEERIMLLSGSARRERLETTRGVIQANIGLFRVVAEQGKRFQDASNIIATALKFARVPADYSEAADWSVKLAESAVNSNKHDTARKFAQTAIAAASESNDHQTIERVSKKINKLNLGP
jgi:hypothetical protein